MYKSAGHIAVEEVPCPTCEGREYCVAAEGPDYDNHCCGDQQFTMVQCNHCCTYYLNPRPTVDTLGVIYAPDKYYSYGFADQGNFLAQRARQSRDRQKIREIMRSFGGRGNGITVLDIGAGDGTLLDAFRSSGVRAPNLCGLDIEPQAVDRLRNRGFQGVTGRIEEVDLLPSQFDVVTMIQVIEHVANPRKVVRSVHRILRPDGVFLLETPNAASWDRRFFSRKTWGGYHFPRHWTLWTPSTIRAMLGNEGFEVLRIETPAAAALWTWSVNHVLQEQGVPWPFTDFFSLNNPFALAIFWLIDLIPSLMGRSANMRVLARKPLS
jgi:2-polyprenyl-3-methyl-5-hydroxy-6-metoxy-1,4-benzoquinol methylase